MQKKDKIVKKLFPKEKEVMRTAKKSSKPWIMQYKWLSEEAFRKQYTWISRKYTSDWQDHYDNYLSIEHALQMLNKELRSWQRDKYKDRSLRLYNKETKESILLTVGDNSITVDHGC